jgi:hypothetical protein
VPLNLAVKSLAARAIILGQLYLNISSIHSSMNSAPPPFALPASFVHLTPLNIEARQAFNDVALLVKNLDSTSQVSDVRHPAKFMVIEPWSGRGPSQPPREPLLPLSEAGIENNSFDSSPLPELEELQYQGFYDLSFEKLPDIPRNGWVAGIGRWNSDSSAFTRTGVVDLMLAPSDGKKLYGVRGKHAIFYFDSSGSLCIKSPPPGTPIFLGTEEFSSGSRVVSSRSQIVSFGNLTYCLEYANADEFTYQSNLNAYFRSYLSSPAPPPDISATPSPWDFTIDDWVCKGTAGSGGFGTVSAAKHRLTGEPAAAKTIMRTSKTMRDIAEEIFILEHLPRHPRLLVKRGVYYERGDTWFTSPDNEDDERHGLPARPERVMFIIQPFARLTLTELLPKLSPDLKIMVFHQLLQGVHALHNANPFPLVHRDLKLSNIGVVSYDDHSIAVVILDYGQTIQAQSRKPIRGKAGTPGYQAPEMLHQIHGLALDIWSCGIIGLSMFVPEWQVSSNIPVQADFQKGVGILKSHESTTPEHLIAQMLNWESDKRISAFDALLHPCFATVAKKPSSSDLSAGKRYREED